MTTALDEINGACKLLGILAAGETLPSEDTTDALEALQDMLDSWVLETLLVPLPQPATLTTDLYLPTGYRRAFKYNIAVEIAPYFGITPSRDVSRIAMATKRVLKRNNVRIEDLRMEIPEAIPVLYDDSNIITGV